MLAQTTTLVFLAVLGAVPTTPQVCPSVCKCRWKNGRETVECIGQRLPKIPSGLNPNTQVLDLSQNNLRQLIREVFYNAGLVNLQRVYLADCKLRKIDDSAFHHLANLVELDLSENLLIAVPSETFPDYPGLRRLNLNKNPIRRVETSAFARLSHLAMLELSQCLLEYVGPRAFAGLTALHQLKLDGNQLTTLAADTGLPLPSLQSVDLFDNPWHCDCHLRALRNLLYQDELPINAQPKCLEPPQLRGILVEEVPPNDFACSPTGMDRTGGGSLIVVSSGEDARIPCQVSADPEARVTWTALGRVVKNLTRFSRGGSRGQMFLLHERGTVDKVSVLTITSVGMDDEGEYLCTARNPAGSIILNFTLEVSPAGLRDSEGLGGGHLAGIGTALACAGLGLFGLIFAILWRVRRRRRLQADDRKSPSTSEDGKKEHVHLVNHVKFDVSKNKLELASEHAYYKPLCAVGETLGTEALCSLNDGNIRGEGDGGCCVHQPVARSCSFGGSGNLLAHPNRPDVVNVGDIAVLTSPGADERMERWKRKGSGSLDETWRSPLEGPSCEHRQPPLGHIATLPRAHVASQHSAQVGRLFLCGEPLDLAAKHSPELAENGVFRNFGNTSSAADFAERNCWERALEHNSGNESANSVPEESLLEGTGGDSMPSPSRLLPFSLREGYQSQGEGEGWSQQPAVLVPRGGYRNVRGGRGARPPIPPKRYGATFSHQPQVKHAALLARHFVPVLPPLPAHHFAQVRDSPDEGYEDDVVDEGDNL